MNIVEEATRRLEQLARAGVTVPWAAAGLENRHAQQRAENGAAVAAPVASSATVHRLTAEDLAEAALARKQPRRSQARAPRAVVTVTLDLQALESSGHLVPSQRRTPLAEEFRQVKRPLLTAAHAEGLESRRQTLIMITSALSGEGKTFCAINLAMSIAAEIDRSVLLVDADVVQPNLMRRLGVPPMPGLLDVLTDPTVELAQLVSETNVPKLSILSAGTPNAMSTELLASEAMEHLLASMVEDHPDRVVIFDGPPLLLTSEAQVLASRVGQVVLVVEAGRTPRQALAQAFALLETCPVVLPLLNKAQHTALPLEYGYVREAEQGQR